MKNAKDEYADIIGLEHHVSRKYPQMPRENRAAQFSPFAALTGYGDLIDEAAEDMYDYGVDETVDESDA